MTQIGVGISPTFSSLKIQGAPPTPIPDTLNPDPSTLHYAVLSNGNLSARIPVPGGYIWTSGSARSLTPKSTGKYYFETWTDFDNNHSAGAAGIGLSSITPANAANLTGMVGWFNPRYYSTAPSRVAVDFTAGKIWFSNTFGAPGLWFPNADPETGATPTFTFTPSGSYCFFLRPWIRKDSYGVLEAYLSVNFGSSPFVYSIPNGFTIWTQ